MSHKLRSLILCLPQDDDYYDYEYGASSYLVGSQDGYGHKKKHKKTKKKKVIEICSNSNSGIFAFFSLGTLMLNATINFMFREGYTGEKRNTFCFV